MNRKELLLKAKGYGIKGIYRMKKQELETAIFLYECASWFNDIAGNTIIVGSSPHTTEEGAETGFCSANEVSD